MSSSSISRIFGVCLFMSMVFDGDTIDMNKHTPKILDMEDEDMVDLN